MKKDKKECRCKDYEVYIFDYYGTLVDIKTDEGKDELWDKLAETYAAYGADYEPKKLCKETENKALVEEKNKTSEVAIETAGTRIHAAYDRLCEKETELLKQKLKEKYPDMNVEYPEILLERVFARLLMEAPESHDVVSTINGKNPARYRVASTCEGNSYSEKEKNTKHENINKNGFEHEDMTDAGIGQMQENAILDELSATEWVHMVSNVFRIISRERIGCYPNTISTLKRLKEKGKKLYLLSNAQGSFTRTELEMTGVLPYLDGVYISSDKEIKKPQPEFLKQLMNEYGIVPETAVMVGNDMHDDMGIATAMGIDGVLLNTYGWTTAKINEEMKKIGADPTRITVLEDGDISHLLKI